LYKTHWQTVVRGNVLMLGLVSFFTDASSEMIYPLLPVYFTGLVSSAAAPVYIGLMDGIAESVSSLLKIYSGRLSDALGKRKLLAVLGYAISTISRPMMAFAGAGWQVVLLRFFDRVGKGIRTSPRDALISDSVHPAVRGFAFSFHRTMDHAGAVLGPVLAALVLYSLLGTAFLEKGSEAATPEELGALRWLFGFALIPGLLAMIVLTGKVREISGKAGSVEKEGAAQDKTANPGGHPHPLPKRFYLYLGAVTLFTLGNSSDLFLVFYAKTRFQMDLLQVIGLWVALHLSKIFFSLPGGHLSDRYGRRMAIVSGWAIYVGVYFGLAFVSKAWMLWGLILIYGAYYGLTEGAERALVADFVPSDKRGRAFGLFHGAVGLAALPASLLFGVFWASLGPKTAFTIGASLAAAALILLSLVLKERETA